MSKIMEAMGLVNEFHQKHGITQRGGKKYTQVVHRMEAFRTIFGLEYGVDTQIIVDDGQRVVVKAIITNADGITVGSGMAEEIRGQGHVNTTSALENCESSAIGRALASIGLAGGEYASANEMDAVPRKAENLKHQAVGSNDTPNSPPPLTERAPQPDPDDPHKQADIDLYRKIANDLIGKKARVAVESYFAENKAKIKAVKDRSPEKAEGIMMLFTNKLADLEKGL
jgi:hypothetical protein